MPLSVRRHTESYLEAAKRCAVRHVGTDANGRVWKTASISAYDNDDPEIVLHALEGTPHRAYVAEYPRYKMAYVLDSLFKRVRRFDQLHHDAFGRW